MHATGLVFFFFYVKSLPLQRFQMNFRRFRQKWKDDIEKNNSPSWLTSIPPPPPPPQNVVLKIKLPGGVNRGNMVIKLSASHYTSRSISLSQAECVCVCVCVCVSRTLKPRTCVWMCVCMHVQGVCTLCIVRTWLADWRTILLEPCFWGPVCGRLCDVKFTRYQSLFMITLQSSFHSQGGRDANASPVWASTLVHLTGGGGLHWRGSYVICSNACKAAQAMLKAWRSICNIHVQLLVACIDTTRSVICMHVSHQTCLIMAAQMLLTWSCNGKKLSYLPPNLKIW